MRSVGGVLGLSIQDVIEGRITPPSVGVADTSPTGGGPFVRMPRSDLRVARAARM